MEQNKQIQGIIWQFRSAYDGQAWHGPNIQYCLGKIDHETALARLGDSKSIAEILLHMIAWRRFTLEKLLGNVAFDLKEPEQNFPPLPQPFNTQAWTSIKEQMANTQNQLLAKLEGQNDELLEQKVSGRKYTFYQLLNGVLQHDLYHLGQIRLLGKYA